MRLRLERPRWVRPKVLARQRCDDAHAVMCSKDVHQTVENFRRIVFDDAFHSLSQFTRLPIADEIYDACAERVVHDRVQPASFEVVLALIVSNFVGRVFPDFPEDDRIGPLCFCGGDKGVQKIIRQFVRHVKTPSAGARAKPFPDDSIAAGDKFDVSGIPFVQLRQSREVPPGVIRAVVMKEVPAAEWGIRIAVRA